MTESFVQKGGNARDGEGYCADLETIRKTEYPLLNGMAFKSP